MSTYVRGVFRRRTNRHRPPPAVCVCARAFAPAQPGGAGRPRRRLFRL